MTPELSPVKYEVSQVAMIVNDLEATIRTYHKLHGWAPWNIHEYHPPRLHDLRVRGVPDDVTWVGAEVEVGAVWIELLQPLYGDAVFGEWLARHGEGVHHVGYWAETQEEAARIRHRLSATGATELMSAWIDDVYFYYMDTHPVVTEIWTGDLDSLRPVRTFP